MNGSGQNLADALAQEVVCLEQLSDILVRERKALVERDPAALEQVTADKSRCLENQARANRLRRAISDPLLSGADVQEANLDTVFARFENYQQLTELHRRFRDVADDCQQLNRGNGRLIARQQQHTRDALKVLQRSDTQGPTYSPRGPAGDNPSKRILGTA